jgi:hypothetical protein
VPTKQRERERNTKQHPSACSSQDAVLFHQLAIACFEICHEREYRPGVVPDVDKVVQMALVLRVTTRIKLQEKD